MEAIFGIGKEQHNCTMQWYTIAALTVMIIGLTIYVLATMQNEQYSKEDCISIQLQWCYSSQTLNNACQSNYVKLQETFICFKFMGN